ncbi:MAG: hypothetical protein ACOYOK_14255, partial [Pseudobdellovibrionaceae bacterium]
QKPSDSIIESQSTSFFFRQLKSFETDHIAIFIFCYLLFSLYMNSFFRSAVLMGFMLLPLTVTFAIRWIFGWGYHLDSLWMLYLISWSVIAILIPLSRTTDVLRLRGLDRDKAIDEVRMNQVSLLWLSFLFLPLSLFFVSIFSFLLPEAFFGLWIEGPFIGVLMACASWISVRYLFPIYYLHGEEYVEAVALRLAKYFYTKKSIKNSKYSQ